METFPIDLTVIELARLDTVLGRYIKNEEEKQRTSTRKEHIGHIARLKSRLAALRNEARNT